MLRQFYKDVLIQTHQFSHPPHSTIHHMTSHDQPATIDTSQPVDTSSTEPQLKDSPQPINTTFQNASRLPKLVLPMFSDNPLEWQTLWDIFSASIDANPILNKVQKFSYLRARCRETQPKQLVDSLYSKLNMMNLWHSSKNSLVKLTS